MDTMKDLISFFIVLAGIACIAIFLYGIVKMMFNLEEKDKYKKRVTNALIAFICILNIFVVKDLIIGYIGSSSLGIGKIEVPEGAILFDDIKDQDCQKRPTVWAKHDGQEYFLVCTDTKDGYNYWRLFADCQSFPWYGALADIYFASKESEGTAGNQNMIWAPSRSSETGEDGGFSTGGNEGQGGGTMGGR